MRPFIRGRCLIWRGHLLEVHFLFIKTKFIRTPRLKIGLVFHNISWSTKFELKRTLSFKRADQKMNFTHYSWAGVALALPKLTHKKEHFRLSQKLLALIKKACNTVIVEVVIIQSWTIWIIQIKGCKSGWQLCSYHNQDRKAPSKHGDIKSPVFIGIIKYQSFICKFYDILFSLRKTPKQKEEYLKVFIEYLKCVDCLFEC